ncbi:hypothetical protein [Nafulsella turpanensis]|uniref:hypothetical protein n=1 Tax=Nafulsella turpanensis TaxID=1265690 RepID=UPI00036D3F76|nr:hypothetical protein [Nafulsella turpanensis]
MKKLIGIILFVAGLVASLIYGLEVYQNTESVNVLGNKITLSQANWTPLIVSIGVAVTGIILIVSQKAKTGTGRRRR